MGVIQSLLQYFRQKHIDEIDNQSDASYSPSTSSDSYTISSEDEIEPHKIETNITSICIKDSICVVCLERPFSAVLVPCGHASFCYRCATVCGVTCPICRTPIRIRSKLYM